jgi:anti-sigma factor RsiW
MTRRTRRPSAEGARPAEVAPICGLVCESISARVDGEAAPVTGAELDRHLARCPRCRAFQARLEPLATLVRADLRSPPVLKRSVLQRAVAGSGTTTRAGTTIGRAWSALGGRLPWALPAMAALVVVPPIALGIHAQVPHAASHALGRCATLLSFTKGAVQR